MEKVAQESDVVPTMADEIICLRSRVPRRSRSCMSSAKRQLGLMLVLVTLVAVTLVAALGSSAGATSLHVHFRVYDSKGLIHARITLAGLVRAKTSASHGTKSTMGELTLVLNRTGARANCRLSRGLAHRGARLHRVQHEIVTIDDWSTQLFVDYRASPDGLCGIRTLTFSNMSFPTARRLAQSIRG